METGEEVREFTTELGREGDTICIHSFVEAEELEVEELSFRKLLF